jgi:glycosyltransferase involved in cell wall biosynthesis
MARRLAVTLAFFGHLLRDLAGTLAARLRRQWRRSVNGDEVLAVGVDAFPFFEHMTGVGWYAWNLLRQLTEVDPAIELHLYAHTFAAPDEPSPPPLPTGPRTRFRFHHLPPGFLLPVAPTVAVLRAVVEPLLLALDGIDVYFAPNFFPPRRHAAAQRRLVVTVHDLAFRHLPNTVQKETLDALERQLPTTLAAADAIIAVSQATADDLHALLGVNDRRVHVVHEGVDATFNAPGGALPPGLPARFLLFVSTLEPRKNLAGLLAGFERAVADGYGGDLVLVGRWGWRTEAARRAFADSPVRGRIHHLDGLDRPALNAAMRRAEALLFPSLLEGFGLPVLEAMACGLPVITSNRSSLPEVAGEAALYVDPDDPASIAGAIMRLAGQPALREQLVEAGRRRAARFTWDNAATATSSVLRRAAGMPQPHPDAYRV